MSRKLGNHMQEHCSLDGAPYCRYTFNFERALFNSTPISPLGRRLEAVKFQKLVTEVLEYCEEDDII